MAEPNKPIPAEAGEADVVEKGKKGGKGFLLMLLPILVLSLTGGGWIAFSYYPAVARTVVTIGSNFGSEEEEDGPEEVEYGQFTEIAGLIVNPSGSGGRRYLMVNMALETPESAVLEELIQKDVVVRDTILKLLGKRSVEELSAIEQREGIKTELLTEINLILVQGQLSRIYFTQYVLQ